ncbi:flippase [Candidatus Pacearchaeota archaeon]|nr:flippase [Candidatus Pacearchaeota archaeon]
MAEKSDEKLRENVAGMTQTTEISSAPKSDSSSEDSLDYLTKQIAKGSGITLLGAPVGKGFQALGQIVVARLLGIELFGFYTLGLTVLKFLEMISRLGLTQGGIRYTSLYYGVGDERRAKGTIIQAISLPFLVGIFLGAVAFVSSKFISTSIFHHPELNNVIKAFSIGIPFLASMMIAVSLTKSFKVAQYFVYVKEIFHSTSGLLLFIVFYLFGFRLYGAVYAYVLSTILGLFLSIYYINKLFPKLISVLKPIYETRKLLSFSLPLAFAGISHFFLMWTDIFMLGYFRSASEVGIYRAAVALTILFDIFIGSIASIFTPTIADLYNKGEISKIKKLFKTTTRWCLFSSVLPFTFVILYPKFILGTIYGNAFIGGWIVLLIFSFARLFSNSVGTVNQMLSMTGRQNLVLYNALGRLLINFFLNLFLIPKWGIIGAAIATGFTIILFNVVALIEILVTLNVHPYDKEYSKVAVSGVVAILIVTGVKVVYPGSVLTSFILAVLFATIGYGFMMHLLGLQESDREILLSVMKKIKRTFSFSH